jgi:hypothetical protein
MMSANDLSRISGIESFLTRFFMLVILGANIRSGVIPSARVHRSEIKDN